MERSRHAAPGEKWEGHTLLGCRLIDPPVPTPAVQEGKTALMMAADKGFNDVVRCLLHNKANVNLATKVRSACTETSELSDGLCDAVILP
jgi:hypothetical protein